MAKILIIGGSRGIGLEAIKCTLQRGHTATAFARNPEEITLEHPHFDRVQGDARNVADIAPALSEVDAVIMTLGVKPGPRRMFRPVTLFSSATRILLAAMAETGVRRLVAITGLGASESRSVIPLIARPAFDIALGNAYDDKGRQERLIADSETDWTIIRPGILINTPASQKYKVLDDPSTWRPGLTSRADAAAFAVACAIDGRYLRRAPLILTHSIGCPK
jgi:putative NADH-flavin reductase